MHIIVSSILSYVRRNALVEFIVVLLTVLSVWLFHLLLRITRLFLISPVRSYP
jgi:hypothetical protein